MIDRGRLLALLTVPLVAAALGACGGLPGAPGAKPTDPVPSGGPARPSSLSAAPDALADPSGSAIPEPTPSMQVPVCEGGPLGCRLYSSVSGRDASGEIAWLKTQPLVVSTLYVNGTWNLGVHTPCNGLGVEVEVQGDRLIPGEIIATAKGCLGPEGGYERWAVDFFRQPVTWTLDGQSLVMENSHGTVEFRDSGENPNM